MAAASRRRRARSAQRSVKTALRRADVDDVTVLPPPVTLAPRTATSGPGRTPVPDAAPARTGHDAAIGEIDQVAEIGRRLVGAVDEVLAGQHGVAELAVVTLLSGGHLLVEDIPGVGKTLLAQTLARAAGGSFARIQGTPDLLPGDILGSMVPAAADSAVHLEFRPGPIFANVVVLDELNRATPRTQSALLEAAEESTVSVDGDSRRLPDPFFLVATQNPIEIAGTYGLGEAALDRFAAVVTPGRPAPDAELEVLTGRRGRGRLIAIRPVTDPVCLATARERVAAVHVADAVGRYVHTLLGATRSHPAIRLGASTRAGVSLIALARARAAVHGRTHVVADDVAALAAPALGHRVMPVESDGTAAAGRELIADCLRATPPPAP